MILSSQQGDLDIKSMFKQIKIPLITTIVILLMFVLQGIQILSLSAKDEQNNDTIELIEKSNNIMQNFKNIKFQNSIVHEYVILKANGDILSTNLTIIPPSFDFQILKYKGYIYYKNYFFYDNELFYLIVAKKIDYTRLIFLAFLMIALTIAAVVAIMYFSYLSVVRTYLEQKNMTNTFFNDAMHELKTPLGVATINLEMLQLRNKHTHRIKSALKQMKVTYEDVEYFIKNTHINFPKQVLNFSYFLNLRIRFSSTIAHSKNIEIISSIEPNLMVFMSEIEATRLIDNTISNAIKYSKDSSKIIVNLSCSDNYAIFSVQDFGRGIKDTNSIWKRYVREDFSQGGFGLGLSIVLKICLKYEIAHSVASKYGEGSIFTYKIPLYKEKILDKLIKN